MSKDLAFEMQAKEQDELIINSENQTSEYLELMKRLRKKEERLSFSSLNAFSKSPKNFIKYKLKKDREQTESMILGSLCDCLITCEHKLQEEFALVNNMPSTDNQKGFCKDIIEGKTKEEAFKLNYSRGDCDKTFESLKDYINAVKSKKTIYTSKLLEEAKLIVENLKKSSLISEYLDSCNDFQNKKEWEYNGWKFIGFTDCEGVRLQISLKFTKDANPDKFERDIINKNYYMQEAMYCEADGSMPEIYFIAFDRSLNFSIIKLDYSLFSYGIRKYKYLIHKLNDCIKNNRWNESYNFWDVEMRTIYKPSYIKGFETDEDNVE